MTWPAGGGKRIGNGTAIQPRTLQVLFLRSRGLRRAEIANLTSMGIKAVDSQILMAREALGVDTFGLDQLLALGGELKTNHRKRLTAGYGPVCAGNYGLPWGE